MTEFDVVIVGAGVAGCAAAVELRSMGWRVGLLYQRRQDASRIETLSPGAVDSLCKLGLEAVGQSFPEVVAWWGSDHAKRSTYCKARVVQRSKLAELLRSRAVEKGASLHDIVGVQRIGKQGYWWSIECGVPEHSQCTFTATYLIDATGQQAILARLLAAKRIIVDRLLSLSLQITEPRVTGTWTESSSEGWWNFSSLPEEGTLSFYSNTAAIREARSHIFSEFNRTRHLRTLISTHREVLTTTVSPCGSSFLMPCAEPGWFAIGDAAWTVQPLASAGTAKALRDARVIPHLVQQNSASYDGFQRAEFAEYYKRLQHHYSTEKRWLTSPFWACTLENNLRLNHLYGHL